MRKTVEVRYLVERGNYFLAHSEPEQREQRLGTCAMIELALHKADAYGGYLHLESAEINHDGWNNAWDWHRATAEIRKANGIVGYNNNSPRWEDYCKDDSRRAYMMKGQPIPNTRV